MTAEAPSMRIRALRCSFCGKKDAEVAPADEHRSPGRRRGLIRRFVDWIAFGLGRSEFRAVSG
jgi:ribosomal protein S14